MKYPPLAVGQTIGRMTLVERQSRPRADGNGTQVYWLCRCSCGAERWVLTQDLNCGKVKSCGCLSAENASTRRRTHGLSEAPEHDVWSKMKGRCHNPEDARYPYYGARGIIVCDRWRDSFDDFLADMGRRPSPGHSIERVDNDVPYGPGNCVWATRIEQGRNKRNNVWITAFGRTQILAEWARESGLAYTVIVKRMKDGWSAESAVSTPARR